MQEENWFAKKDGIFNIFLFQQQFITLYWYFFKVDEFNKSGKREKERLFMGVIYLYICYCDRNSLHPLLIFL